MAMLRTLGKLELVAQLSWLPPVLPVVKQTRAGSKTCALPPVVLELVPDGSLSPQHHAAPELSMAQALAPNLLTVTEMGFVTLATTAAGGEDEAVVPPFPSWPLVFAPQQRTPSVASRQVKSLPEAIILNVFPEMLVVVGEVGIKRADVVPSPS
jgi:hypothetical protein